MKGQYSRNQSKGFRQECIKRYGTVCINCGSSDRIEWHHVVPLEIGGNDDPSNCVPLCYSCHKAVTNHQLVIVARMNEWKHGALTGRKALCEDGWDDILMDYIECRVSASETAERLGGRKSFRSLKMFGDFKKRHGIIRHRNNIDTILKFHSEIPWGACVGSAEYADGTKKRFYWKPEEETPREPSEAAMEALRASANFKPSNIYPQKSSMRKQSQRYQLVYEDGNPYIVKRS